MVAPLDAVMELRGERKAVELGVDETFESFFCNEALTSARAAKAKKSLSTADSLQANRAFALALDNVVRQSVGRAGLQQFVALPLVGALAKGEQRRFVQLPEHLRISGCAPRRSVIVNTSFGERRVELPRVLKLAGLWRPTLHKARDQGSIGRVCTQRLD
jgi:hypothetical protein